MIWKEPEIVVNGRRLSDHEARTMRIAILRMGAMLKVEGLGNDDIGVTTCNDHLACCASIMEAMLTKEQV